MRKRGSFQFVMHNDCHLTPNNSCSWYNGIKCPTNHPSESKLDVYHHSKTDFFSLSLLLRGITRETEARYIMSRVWAIKDGVRIGNWIY
jgi:hypothetical protein